MIETWNGVGFLVDLREKCETGGDHFFARGEGGLLFSGILEKEHDDPWFVILPGGCSRGKTFAGALSSALRDAERNYKSAQRFWEVSRNLESERMQGDE